MSYKTVFKSHWISLLVLAVVASMPAAGAGKVKNDYPTAARADYVFGCMASNGQTQQMLQNLQ